MDVVDNMESVGGAQSCVPDSSSSKRGRLSYVQGSVLWFLVFSAQMNWVASKRNMEIIDDPTTRVWNKTLLKDIGHCMEFHEANASSYFFYWPEDSFEYCCQGTNTTTNGTMNSYRYSMYGNSLFGAPYYDLGLIDECLPYYTKNCLHLYDSYMASPVYYTSCEWSDVIRLYNHRFWRLVFGKYGLAMTALPLIGFLQLSVLLVIALEVVYRRYRHSKDMKKLEMSSQKLRVMAERWMNGSWKNTWMDWVHLCLLSIIGNGLIEAVGRTDPYSWQAKTFQRYSIVYLALSVILWVSSFLHQVTHWIAVDKKESKKWNKATSVSTEPEPASVEDGAAPEAPTLQHSDPASETSVQIDQKTESNTSRAPNISSERETFDPASVARLRKLLGPVLGLEKNNARKKDPVAQLRKLLELGPDWKWQPIAAQTAILFCLWAFLTYPTDENDNLGSTLLGFLVQAASPWSGLYAGRVLFLTLPFLLKKIFNVHHIRHLPKHLLHRYRNRKQATPESKAAKKLPEWLQWGPVLYCVGCFSSEPAPPKKIQASESSSSSGSDSDSDV